MRGPAGGLLLLALAAASACTAAPAPAPVLVDGFEDSDAWQARPADGVELTVGMDAGVHGRALRLDFRFVKGGGYAVIHRDVSFDLPENYRFRFRVRGDCPPENLEFKLVDSSRANVWWSNQRDFRFPTEWDSVTLKKRKIGFAWGPAGGGEIRHVGAIEFAVTAGSGGMGTVWLDDLTLEELPPPQAAPPAPRARATSARPGHGAPLAVDGAPATAWESAPGDARPALTLDLGTECEFGGLVLDWAPGRHLVDYAIETSPDGVSWHTLREVRGGNGGRDWLYLPETEARFLCLRALAGVTRRGCGLRELTIEPLAWGASFEAFFEAIAKDAPRGTYPRAFSGEQPYWTVVGTDGGREKGLLEEDGRLEVGRASWSLEPFLYEDGKLVTWADAKPAQGLDRFTLPIPSVYWPLGKLSLEVTAWAIGAADTSSVVARYRVRNAGNERRRVRLVLALRPFQVNPPAQFLNTPGGAATIRTIAREGRVVRVNGDRGVVSLTTPSAFGAATFDQGDVVADFLRRSRLPRAQHVDDPFAHASAALAYDLDIAPGAEREVDLLVPLHVPPTPPAGLAGDATVRARVQEWFDACRAGWQERIDRVDIRIPEVPVDRALRAQLGWILVNRDGAAFQPGARSYARSWIRDGALTSSALLRLGHSEAVRDFIEWFAPYQYADGKVPCCVDQRGSDPVPEHDSGGEFIFLVAEYFRYTGDSALAQRMWPAVARAATYLDSLRQTRRTADWRVPGKEPYFGLLPPSISHEGYSAKPMHSYWDDFFALRGFKDAAYLAGALGRSDDAVRLAAVRDTFQRELVASIAAAMKAHAIAYIPGCADLGDFDPTSTTIALAPAGALGVLPRAAVDSTFERYWRFFDDRARGKADWEAFTPYEVRTIGAFVRLGWRYRAQELLRFFLGYQRPPGWAQWAEVVWKDARTPHFIGDMPHTWVGSDFVRSVLDMLAYEREEDSTLVVGAGVPPLWVTPDPAPGHPVLAVRGLPTPYGKLTYTMRATSVWTDTVEVRIERGLRVPAGGIVVRAPLRGPIGHATVNGAPVPVSGEGEVVVRELPADVVLRR